MPKAAPPAAETVEEIESLQRVRRQTSDGVDAVDRALTIVDAFSDGTPRLALKDLAQRTGFNKPTILRLCASLERFGYLLRNPRTGEYSLGVSLWRLGSLFRHNLTFADVIRPELALLAQQTGESASFYIIGGKGRICLLRANSPRPVRHHIEEGEEFSLEHGSTSHVLKAFTGQAGAKYQAIRDAGYAVALGERDPDIAGVSAPVFGPERMLIGAITLSGLLQNYTEQRVEVLVDIIQQSAQKISRELGAA